jgi:tRNA(fMet)-specific endonuclease VapC
MKYLLDTNVCITFLSQRNPVLNQRFSSVSAQDKIVCSIVRAELYYGVYKSQRQQMNLLRIDSFLTHLPSLPFDDHAARVYGALRADLEMKGTPIGSNDLQIAAIALANHRRWSHTILPNLVAFLIWRWTIGNHRSF